MTAKKYADDVLRAMDNARSVALDALQHAKDTDCEVEFGEALDAAGRIEVFEHLTGKGIAQRSSKKYTPPQAPAAVAAKFPEYVALSGTFTKHGIHFRYYKPHHRLATRSVAISDCGRIEMSAQQNGMVVCHVDGKPLPQRRFKDRALDEAIAALSGVAVSTSLAPGEGKLLRRMLEKPYDISLERMPKIQKAAERMCHSLMQKGFIVEADELEGVYELTAAGRARAVTIQKTA